MKKLTQDQFIANANTTHGNVYDYSAVVYINNSTHVNIICALHGMFSQTPQKHTKGQGCPSCASFKRKETNIKKYGVENPFGNKAIQDKIKETNLEKYDCGRPLQNKDIQNKLKETNIKKYGVENPMQNDTVKLRVISTNLEKYGFSRPLQNSQILDKVKQSNIKRYGVENPGSSKEIQDKIKQSNIERYGCNSPFGNKEIQDKVKRANIEKYGCENPMQNDTVKYRVIATNLDRYGVACTFKMTDVKNKIRSTNIEKYGCEHTSQSHMVDILPLVQNKEWLFDQYIIQNKTSKHIAAELGISGTTICDYLHKHEIEIRYTTGYSISAVRWLESIMDEEGIFIQHAANGGEFCMPATKYRVDGYCKETNTVYEFHGDCFHGNPDIFAPDDNPNFYKPEMTAKELYDGTIARENEIKQLGYNLVVMWENDFNNKRVDTHA